MSSTELKMFLRSLGNHDDAVVYQTVITDVFIFRLKAQLRFYFINNEVQSPLKIIPVTLYVMTGLDFT